MNTGTGGAVAATDDVGGVHYQKVKLVDGTADSSAVIPGDATNGLDVDVTRVIPGTGATNLGKAEDAAHTSGDTGVSILAVRRDTPASGASADGDYATVNVDANGRVYTNALLASNDGTDIGNVDVASVVPGTGATNLGKAEDAAHTSGDVGVMMLAVRNDAGTVLAGTTGDYIPLSTDSSGALRVTGGGGGTQYAEDAAHTSGDSGTMALVVRRDADTSLVSADGDYAPLQVNAAGSLKVAITSGAGSGGTSIADGASFTRDTTSITPAGAVVETSAPTLTNGDAAALSMTTAGALRVAVASGGIAGIAEDSASAGGEEGVMMLAVRRDSASSGVSADGDFAALSVDSNGALRVSGAAGTTQYTEDAASAGGESLCLSGAVRQDTLASSTSADGDYAALKVTAAGRLYTDASVSSLPASTNTLEVVGDVAHDAAAAGNPLLMGAYASAAAPTDVSADADAVRLWALRSGALATQPTYAGVLATTGNGVAGTGVQRVTIASDSTGQLTTVGGAAQDAAITGNPVPVGMRASTATPTAMSADGDVVYPWATREGAQVIAGAIVDDAAFTPGTSRVVPIAFQADETATDSVDEGDAGTPRMTLDRKVISTPYVHAAAGGATPYKNLDVDETEDDIKTSAGKLYWLHVINLANAKRYLKIYNNVAASVTVGTTVPDLTFPIPTMGDTNGAGFTINFGDMGLQFSTGICIAATTGFADNDTGAPGGNEIILNAGYV